MQLKNWTAAIAGRTVLCVLAGSMIVPMAWADSAKDAEQAEKEFARGNLIVAMALWRKAAGQGNAQAQARLGDILDKAEEDTEAVAWYRKASEQGNADGDYGLGQMYAKGEGVKRDLEQARAYVQRAADKGHVNAVMQMRESHRLGGLGLPVDPEQSAAWDKKLKSLQTANNSK